MKYLGKLVLGRTCNECFQCHTLISCTKFQIERHQNAVVVLVVHYCVITQHGRLISQLDLLRMRPAGPASITKIIQMALTSAFFSDNSFYSRRSSRDGWGVGAGGRGVKMWIK